MKHTTVYSQADTYAGWPANHGHWQWGDEFLVGFIRGAHTIGGMHNVSGRLDKLQARSLDGGRSWTIETPNVDFEASEVPQKPPRDLSGSIVRVCGFYDHGGENCASQGAFYASTNRGRSWEGPFAFDGATVLRPHLVTMTSRTCVLDNLFFLSFGQKGTWGCDFTGCFRFANGVFYPRSIVLSDDARAVMPAVARVGSRIVAVLRRRGSRRFGCWIDSVWSDDDGVTWSAPVHVADTGSSNGNPPALIATHGRFYCAFGNRDDCTINVYASADGELWKHHATLRQGNASDIGYPRLFERADGMLVCVYYWTEEPHLPQRIEATTFSPF